MIDLIKTATLSPEDSSRRNAEAAIVKFRSEQPEPFLLQTGHIFQSSEVESSIRQASANLLALSILSEHNGGGSYLWDCLSVAAKTNIKEIILSLMIDPDRSIRRAAANSVAVICSLQIPRNQWQGIVQNISENINNDDPKIKEISIVALGFICQRLKNKKGFIFALPLQETIISGIMLGVNSSDGTIKSSAFKALLDSIPSIPDVLQKPQCTQYLMKQLIEAIATKNYNQIGLQILAQFAQWNYNLMGNYVGGLVMVLEPIMMNYKQETSCILAIEFWETLANQFRNNQAGKEGYRNYIVGEIGQKLVAILLHNLCVIEDQDNDGNGINDSASKCLQSIFEAGSEEYEKIVLAFTDNTIKNENWRFRQASIRAFAVLLIGLPEPRSQALVNVSLLELVALLNDIVSAVQLSTIKSLTIITQECPACFLHHINFREIMTLIFSKLHVSQNIAQYICKIIQHLSLASKSLQGNYFTGLAEQLIKVLLQTSFQANRTSHSINHCISAIMQLISAANNVQLCKKYIAFILGYFPQIDTLESPKREIFSSSFFSLLQTCLLTLRKEKLEMNTLQAVYQLVVDHYKKIADVDCDSLYTVGALSYFFVRDRRMFDNFWVYIYHCLKKSTEDEAIKAAIFCISDFANNNGELISDKIDLMFTEFFKCFQTNECSRDTKLHILVCFGQLFLHCKEACRNYLNKVMTLIFLSCEASLKLFTIDNAYAEELQQKIIETLTCIMYGLTDQGRVSTQFTHYIANIFQFIQLSTNKANRPKLEYVKKCVLLIADIASIYRKETRALVAQPFVGQMMQVLSKYNKNNSLTGIINYARSKI